MCRWFVLLLVFFLSFHNINVIATSWLIFFIGILFQHNFCKVKIPAEPRNCNEGVVGKDTKTIKE